MRCLSCETENEVAAVSCVACGMGMVGVRLGQAILDAEQLIGQARYKQAHNQLFMVEAEMKLAHLDERTQQLALARTLVDWARLHFNQGEHNAALEAAHRALTFIDAATAAWWIRTHAYNVLASVAQYQERLEDANRYIKQALTYAEQGGDHYTLAMILNNKASQESDHGELEAALGTYQAALRHLEQTSIPALLSLVNRNLAEVNMGMGYIHLALFYAERAREQAVVSGNRIRLCDSMKLFGRAYTYTGDLQLARSWLTQALDEANASGSAALLVEVSSALAEYHLLAENYPLAQHYARQVLNGRSGDLREEVPALAIMVHSAIWQGDLDSAQRSLSEMTELVEQRERTEQNSIHYLVLTADPSLQMAKGNGEEGGAGMALAIRRIDSSSHRYAQALARLMCAKAVLRFGAGEYQLARRVLLEAETRFGDIAALRYQEQVAVMLAALPASGKN